MLCENRQKGSDIQRRDVQRVLFDEFPARLDLVPHQAGEDLVGVGLVAELDAQQLPRLRVHRRLPELIGVHLPQALVPLDRLPLLRGVQHLAQQTQGAVGLHSAISDLKNFCAAFSPESASAPSAPREASDRKTNAGSPRRSARAATCSSREIFVSHPASRCPVRGPAPFAPVTRRPVIPNSMRYLRNAASSFRYVISLPRRTPYSGGWGVKMFPRSSSSRIWRKKKVSSSVRMCAPSTSASVMMMTLP